MTGAEMQTSVTIEGHPVAESDEAHATLFSVTPDYFRTMKIALLQGRDFNAQDGLETKPVVIVNESLARQFFPGENQPRRHDLNPLPQAPGQVEQIMTQELHHSLMGSSTNFILILVAFSVLT